MIVADVTCVGTGTVGRSWAVAFASAGYRVTLFDAARSACDDAVQWINETLKDLEDAGLVENAQEATSRVAIGEDLGSAVAQAAYVQESVPEVLEIKQAVFRELGQWSRPNAVLASSTSELPGRLFMSDIVDRSRALVAHPVNPPHLIPVVELSPTPWTSQETMEHAESFLRSVGQEPIYVRKEIGGFIVNRLQMALIGEALHLVGEGYCSPDDLDKAVRFGLGLRWAFMGPFETGHLNAPGGYLEYMTKFRGSMEKLLGNLKVNTAWDGDVIRQIDSACQRVTPTQHVIRRQKWRDAQLMSLRKHFARSIVESDAARDETLRASSRS
jgi:L-gulonate 3-dehydrogenase